MIPAHSSAAAHGQTMRLALAATAVGFGQSAILALVPVTAAQTGLDPASIGGVALLGSIIFVVCAPAWGAFGREWRLRRLFGSLAALMVLGHGLFALALLRPGLSGTEALVLLAAARVAYGAGAAGVMPHAQAALVRTVPEDARPTALGHLGAGLSMGRILGSLAMVTGMFGALAPLAILVASPLLLLAAPDPALGRTSSPKATSPVGVPRGALPLLAIAFALTFGLGQIQIVLGLFLQQRFGFALEAAAGLAGATFALVAVTMILTQLLVVPRLGHDLRRNLCLGLLGFSCGAALIAGTPAPGIAMLGTAVAGAGIALATPTYTATLVSRVPEPAQAVAAGWLASVHVLGQGVGALCGGAAFRIAPTLPFWTCAALGLLLVLGAMRLPGRHGGHGPAAERHAAPSLPSSCTVATVATPESSVASPNRAP